MRRHSYVFSKQFVIIQFLPQSSPIRPKASLTILHSSKVVKQKVSYRSVGKKKNNEITETKSNV